MRPLLVLVLAVLASVGLSISIAHALVAQPAPPVSSVDSLAVFDADGTKVGEVLGFSDRGEPTY